MHIYLLLLVGYINNAGFYYCLDELILYCLFSASY